MTEDIDMTFDEALIMLETSQSPGNHKAKLEVATRTGGMITAIEKAYQIARECIKRCRDFDELRAKVGGKIYFACFDDSFPEESDVTEYEIRDITAAGLVRILDTGDNYDWVDPRNPNEQMYWTQEEAEEALKRMKEAAG